LKNSTIDSIETIWNRNFICILTTAILLGLMHFSVNPLVASYAIHLGASALVMGLLTGMFFGIALSLRPITGPVVTAFDKRKLLILAYTLGGVVNIGYALFHSIPLFIVFRFLHGAQYSLIGTLTMTLAGDNLPTKKMASGIGIYGLCVSIGMAIGPMIGIRILEFGTHLKSESFGFSCVFLFAMVVSLIAVIPSYILFPDKKTKEDLLTTGVWYKNIFSVPASSQAVVMFLLFIGWSLYNVYIVELAKELQISGISAFYTVLAAFLIISRPISGWLTDKIGLAKVIIPALILFAVSFLVVGFSQSLGPMLVASAIAALGFGAFQPAIFAMCIFSETPQRRGVASNTIYMGIDLGLFVGPILGSMVYKAFNYSTMFKSTSLVILASLGIFVLLLPAYYRRCQVLITKAV
jgi:MFS family permease